MISLASSVPALNVLYGWIWGDSVMLYMAEYEVTDCKSDK